VREGMFEQVLIKYVSDTYDHTAKSASMYHEIEHQEGTIGGYDCETTVTMDISYYTTDGKRHYESIESYMIDGFIEDLIDIAVELSKSD